MTEEEKKIYEIQNIIEDNYDNKDKATQLVQNALDGSEFTPGAYLELLTKAACNIALERSAAINNMSLNY